MARTRLGRAAWAAMVQVTATIGLLGTGIIAWLPLAGVVTAAAAATAADRLIDDITRRGEDAATDPN